MGCCFSSESDYSRHHRTSATVISVTGQLRLYPLPITVAQVLQYETSPPDSVFLCNSDRLYFDDFIPRLEAEEELEQAQIYFILPISKLQNRLSGADMAALAVKASVALDASTRRNKKARVSPVMAVTEDPQSSLRFPTDNYNHSIHKNARKVSGKSELGVSRSSSVRKLQRYSSRKAKLAVRSFRLRLTTINEASVLVN